METILGCSMLKEMPFERHFLCCDWGQNTPPKKKKKISLFSLFPFDDEYSCATYIRTGRSRVDEVLSL